MTKVEAIRQVLAEHGDMPVGELVAMLKARFGLEVKPTLVPVIRATLRDQEMLAAARQRRAAERHGVNPQA
jgi:hypothetical protein